MTLARFDSVVVHPSDARQPRRKVDFHQLAVSAGPFIPELVCRWLPDGYRTGGEWTSRNPKRQDASAGSFKVNLRTGRWADFSSQDQGGDVISLAAYLFDMSQIEAARGVAKALGLSL